MSITVSEIKEEARLAILNGLAAQVKFSPSDAASFDFQPLLLIAMRLGFRQRPLNEKDAEQQRKNTPFRHVCSATPEGDYERYPYRD